MSIAEQAPTDQVVVRAFWSPAAVVALAGATLGVGFYLWVAFGLVAPMGTPHFGTTVYDQAFLALLDGRLDLPARVIGFEGHYTPDGTAHFYHGLAPLVTRALLAPFLDIGSVSLASFSIWLWAVLGTALYHATFFRVVARSWSCADFQSRLWSAVLSAAIWLSSPGLILVSNHALYHEPIAMAYALSAGFVFLWVCSATEPRPVASILIGLAILAAIAVHARPNLAVGLYLGVALAIGQALRQGGRQVAGPVVAAVGLLALSGVGQLSLNKVRFGEAMATHGTFEPAVVQYGFVYWGVESASTRRAQGFIDHGRFNAGRVLPNLLLYALAPPQMLVPETSRLVRHWHQSATEARVGYVRVEAPSGGLLALWTCWCLAALAGLFGGREALRGLGGLILAMGTAAALTLAYATVTLRYHVDLWPLIAALSVGGLSVSGRRLAGRMPTTARNLLLLALLSAGLLGNLTTAWSYRFAFQEHEGSVFGRWSEAKCDELAAIKGFSETRAEEICQPPRN